MMTKKKKQITFLLLAGVYFASYLTRTNYAAVLIDMVAREGFTKSAASLALSASAVTYAVGQLVSGYFGDKLKPEKMILFGLGNASLMNLLIIFSHSTEMMTVLWAINGFSQAMIWPPLTRIMAGLFDQDDYNTACVRVSWASAVATICIYLISPLMVRFTSWRGIFVLSAVLAIGMCTIWRIYGFRLPYVRKESVPEDKKKDSDSSAPLPSSGRMSSKLIPILGVMMMAIVLQGVLRDGITTWLPSLVSETFQLGSEVSILSGVFLPVFTMISQWLSSKISKNLIRCETQCAALFFGVCTVCLVLMAIFSNPFICVAAAAIAEGASHGVNFSYTCLVPRAFFRFGRTATISGTLNACTYVGSAFSGVGIAALAEHLSWNGIVWIWAAVAALGMLLSLGVSGPWKKAQRTSLRSPEK